MWIKTSVNTSAWPTTAASRGTGAPQSQQIVLQYGSGTNTAFSAIRDSGAGTYVYTPVRYATALAVTRTAVAPAVVPALPTAAGYIYALGPPVALLLVLAIMLGLFVMSRFDRGPSWLRQEQAQPLTVAQPAPVRQKKPKPRAAQDDFVYQAEVEVPVRPVAPAPHPSVAWNESPHYSQRSQRESTSTGEIPRILDPLPPPPPPVAPSPRVPDSRDEYEADEDEDEEESASYEEYPVPPPVPPIAVVEPSVFAVAPPLPPDDDEYAETPPIFGTLSARAGPDEDDYAETPPIFGLPSSFTVPDGVDMLGDANDGSRRILLNITFPPSSSVGTRAFSVPTRYTVAETLTAIESKFAGSVDSARAALRVGADEKDLAQRDALRVGADEKDLAQRDALRVGADEKDLAQRDGWPQEFAADGSFPFLARARTLESYASLELERRALHLDGDQATLKLQFAPSFAIKQRTYAVPYEWTVRTVEAFVVDALRAADGADAQGCRLSVPSEVLRSKGPDAASYVTELLKTCSDFPLLDADVPLRSYRTLVERAPFILMARPNAGNEADIDEAPKNVRFLEVCEKRSNLSILSNLSVPQTSDSSLARARPALRNAAQQDLRFATLLKSEVAAGHAGLKQAGESAVTVTAVVASARLILLLASRLMPLAALLHQVPSRPC
jgi:hypothetical protein